MRTGTVTIDGKDAMTTPYVQLYLRRAHQPRRTIRRHNERRANTMARPRLKVCSVPGCPALQTATRCSDHARDYERHQRATTPTKIHRDADRARRKAVVNDHRAQHGDWCPGWNRPAHGSTDLTADHVQEIAYGGEPFGPLQVLCRSCNSSKKVTAAHRDGLYPR